MVVSHVVCEYGYVHAARQERAMVSAGLRRVGAVVCPDDGLRAIAQH